jgi:hypothetical protein
MASSAIRWLPWLMSLVAGCLAQPHEIDQIGAAISAELAQSHEIDQIGAAISVELVQESWDLFVCSLSARCGAIYGTPDFAPTDEDFAKQASATVAFGEMWDFQPTEYAAWKPRNFETFEKNCGTCGSTLKHVLSTIGDFPNGDIIGGGVVVRPSVVATAKHVAESVRCDPRNFRAIAGFDASPNTWDLQSHAIERICINDAFSGDFYALALIQIDAQLTPIEIGSMHLEAPSKVVAFSHPWGSARVMVGNNDETYIHRCGDGSYRASLDSLMNSSGSPVYLLGEEGPQLFGILQDAPYNDYNCSSGICDVDVATGLDPCRTNGPNILPLEKLEGVIDSVVGSEEPPKGSEWHCYTPDQRRSCGINVKSLARLAFEVL